MLDLLRWQLSPMSSALSSLESSTSDSSAANFLWGSRRSRSRRERARNGGYFQALRWVMLISLVLMGFMSLNIFTEDVHAESKFQGLLVVMASLALVAFGLYSVWNVRIWYTMLFCFLHMGLMLYKFTTPAFRKNTIASMFYHTPHFFVLFCGWAFTCLGIFKC